MKRVPMVLCAVMAWFAPAHAAAQPQSVTQTMDFEQCLSVIRGTASQLGLAPINIVETGDLRIVRFPTSDGGVLLSCSRLDRKLVITKGTQK